MNLTKKQAIAIFGNGVLLADALGLTKGAISQWPDQLDQKRTAMVLGAAIQHGTSLPEGFVPQISTDTVAV